MTRGRCDGFCGSEDCPTCYPGIIDADRREYDERSADYRQQREQDASKDGE